MLQTRQQCSGSTPFIFEKMKRPRNKDPEEEERTHRRAQRFGLAESDADKERRKQRALRFGIPSSEDNKEKVMQRMKRFNLIDDTEDKRKMREQRFGLNAEKEKIEARAKRFKQ